MSAQANHSIHQDSINQLISGMIESYHPAELLDTANVGQQIKFIDNLVPPIKSGNYTLTIDQYTNQDPQPPNQDSQPPDHSSPALYHDSRDFSIDGPRFKVNPKQILSVFPPAHSAGNHAYVLPHIALDHPSLPWQIKRSELSWLGESSTNVSDDDPWLALLLFSEAEAPDVKTESLSALNLNDQSNDGSEQVHTIEVTETLMNQVLPSSMLNEMKFLAHIRERTINGTPQQVAYVVGNRLPQVNATSVVHLVSLANLPTATSAGSVKFISLYHWRFSCTENRPVFKDLAGGLDARALRLYNVQQNNTYQIENPYTLKGFVPVPHFRRTGEKNLSWYRGPLLPLTYGSIPDTSFSMGAYSSDDYVRIDLASKMLDTTYAAAWELGRMLTLKNKAAALKIRAGKRKIAQMVKHHQLNPNATDPGNYLNFLQSNTLTDHQREILAYLQNQGASNNLQFDPVVAKWLNQLVSLEPVPFVYLVPNPAMLPSESIRFFSLDPYWISYLIEGALSMGDERLDIPTPNFLKSGNQNKYRLSGFLLRSEVVGDYPDMEIGAYSKTPSEAGMTGPIIRRKLSDEVLFCLFDMPIRTVDLYIKPEALHLGFEYNGGNLRKTVRDATSGEQKGTPFNADTCIDTNRVLNFNTLKTLLQNNIQTATGTASTITKPNEFALQMMEGVPKVRVTVQ